MNENDSVPAAAPGEGRINHGHVWWQIKVRQQTIRVLPECSTCLCPGREAEKFRTAQCKLNYKTNVV